MQRYLLIDLVLFDLLSERACIIETETDGYLNIPYRRQGLAKAEARLR
jgi:hypothetical protein